LFLLRAVRPGIPLLGASAQVAAKFRISERCNEGLISSDNNGCPIKTPSGFGIDYPRNSFAPQKIDTIVSLVELLAEAQSKVDLFVGQLALCLPLLKMGGFRQSTYCQIHSTLLSFPLFASYQDLVILSIPFSTVFCYRGTGFFRF
jgi:hypothetical protein